MDADADKFAHQLDWNLLRTFVVVVQEKGISRASQRLMIQQPAISMALRRLEETIGHRLIDRSPGRFDLSPIGQRLFDDASAMYGIITKIPTEKSTDQSELKGHIAIHAVSQIEDRQWDGFLESFFGRNPKATISISIGDTEQVINALIRGVATVGLADGNIPKSFKLRKLMREQHGVYCGRGHPFYGKKNVALEELRDMPFVGLSSDKLGGDHMGAATVLRVLPGIGQFERGASAHVVEVKRLVAANVGFGVLPTHLVEDDLKCGRLWPLHQCRSLASVEIFAINDPNARTTATEQAFLSDMESMWPSEPDVQEENR